MARPTLITLLTLSTLNIAFGSIGSAMSWAQTPPAKTYQPGAWQPIARFDQARPVNVKIINQTGVPIEVDLTANITPAPQAVLPSGSTELKQVEIPAYVLINPTNQAAESANLSLTYNVAVTDENLVMVEVYAAQGNGPSDSTLNLHQTGAVYKY